MGRWRSPTLQTSGPDIRLAALLTWEAGSRVDCHRMLGSDALQTAMSVHLLWCRDATYSCHIAAQPVGPRLLSEGIGVLTAAGASVQLTITFGLPQWITNYHWRLIIAGAAMAALTRQESD